MSFTTIQSPFFLGGVMREGIIYPRFKDKFFRLDFEAKPLPVLSLYPFPPPLKLEEVTFSICGLDAHPRNIPWTALSDLPRVKLAAPLICQIFNWSEGVTWEGIRLVDLIDFLRMDTHPEGYFAFYSRDGVFFEGLSRDEARDPRVLIAYKLNDEPLPEEHGGPVRLVVPFLQGYKSVKWLHAIRGYRNDPIGIKRLNSQSPTSALNETWRSRYNITPPLGKVGDPPLFTPQTADALATQETKTPVAPLSPLVGKMESPTGKKPKGKGALKEIIAIIRPDKHLATRKALEAVGIYSYTTVPAMGRSKQRGLRFPQAEGKEAVTIRFLPKRFFSIVIDEERAPVAMAAIIRANRTGKGTIGDGKIFVVDVENAIRISTDEQGVEAV